MSIRVPPQPPETHGPHRSRCNPYFPTSAKPEDHEIARHRGTCDLEPFDTIRLQDFHQLRKRLSMSLHSIMVIEGHPLASPVSGSIRLVLCPFSWCR